MNIAEIVPVSSLDHIKDKPYHMCLAHLVLQSKEYADFYKNLALSEKFVIMDNGACEGESLTGDQLMRAYEIVNPTEIILPDVLKDGAETLSRSCNFYREYKDELSKYSIMGVPQGKNIIEWKKYALHMIMSLPLDTIGIPKWLGSNDPLCRTRLANYLRDSSVDIHLLGCSEGPMTLIKCLENKNVRSCDSAFAYICTKAGKDKIVKSSVRPENVNIDFLNDPYISTLDKLMDDFETLVE